MLETALALRDRAHEVTFVTNPDSALCQRARAAGLAVQTLTIRLDSAPWTIIALAKHLRSIRATALVANRTKDVKVAAPAARLAGMKTILATRESDFPLKDRLDYRWNFQTLCTGVLVNSHATRHTIMTSAPWLDPARVHLLYKGIDIDRFCPGARPPGPPIVGVVGQLIERKGLPEVMLAWSQIDRDEYQQRPRLLFAGEGIMRQDIAQWRRGLRFPEAVEVLGYTEDVVAFYRRLSLLAMPSRAEGFGLAAAEALACGIPVIAGDASSLPEIVIHEKTGLLVPPSQSEPLYHAMVRLLSDEDLRQKLGVAGRQLICQRYPREQTLTRLLSLTGHPDYLP